MLLTPVATTVMDGKSLPPLLSARASGGMGSKGHRHVHAHPQT
jgi:hypothetical protein